MPLTVSVVRGSGRGPQVGSEHNGLAFGMSADVGQYGDQVKRGAHSDVRHI
jgi:hypothetical protein